MKINPKAIRARLSGGVPLKRISCACKKAKELAAIYKKASSMELWQREERIIKDRKMATAITELVVAEEGSDEPGLLSAERRFYETEREVFNDRA